MEIVEYWKAWATKHCLEDIAEEIRCQRSAYAYSVEDGKPWEENRETADYLSSYVNANYGRAV